VLPEGVQEPPDRGHIVVLPCLYLRRRPVNGVDRWLARCQAAEDPVVDGAVRFHKKVPFGVTGKVSVPALGALPGERALYHDASAAADRVDHPGRHGPGRDVAELDNRPDRPSSLPVGSHRGNLGAHRLIHLGEYGSDIPDLPAQLSLGRADCLANIRRQRRGEQRIGHGRLRIRQP
jgi:hypothetical protein